jgi:hypothetical protein
MAHGVLDLTPSTVTSYLKQVSKLQDPYGEGDVCA